MILAPLAFDASANRSRSTSGVALEVVEGLRDVGMFGPQRFLADGKRAPVERVDLRAAALDSMEPGEADEGGATPGWSGPSGVSRMASERL